MRLRLKLDRLATLLATSHLSQNHWAIRLGISKGHWSDIINGRYPYPSARTRARMLEVFGLAPDDLFALEPGQDLETDTDFRMAVADRYLIDSEVGQGGMGAVYLARDVRHGRLVAIKVISPEAVGGVGLTQFHREISLVARLQHPHNLPLHDSGDAAGHPFYVMPYIKGGSLRHRLQDRVRFSVADVVRLTTGIAAALGHAHRQQVLHCDVKPENILLDGDHAYVMDFGIARILHSEFFEWAPRGELDASAGTPAYVSPEQAAGERNLDGRSDVFSLACVVYEMLAGRAPYEGTNTEEVVARRFSGPTAPLRAFAPDVPAAMEAVIARGMSPKRERRPGTPDEFAAALAAAALDTSTVGGRLAVPATRVIGSVRSALGGRPAFRFIPFDLTDLRLAWRQAVRRPATTAAILVSLALGIAATSAIFSAVNGILLRPLPFGNPDQLVRLWETSPRFSAQLPSAPNLADWQSQQSVFTAIGAWSDASFNLGAHGDPERVHGAAVSPEFFPVLGVTPELGRALDTTHDPHGPPVVVISDQLWRRRFSADSGLVGRVIDVNGVPCTVLGVMPASFRWPSRDADIWAPLTISPGMAAARGAHGFWTVARLRPGVTLARARSQMGQIAQRLAAKYPATNAGHGARVESMHDTLVGDLRTGLRLLSGAAFFVLLIAAINVMALLLAQAVDRRRENAVRVAMGIRRRRLVRQYLTESVALALVGGAAGLLLARWAVGGLAAIASTMVPTATSITLDARVAGFAVAVSVLTGLVCGVVPAWRASMTNLSDDLRDGSGGAVGRRRHWFRDLLVVTQVASAVILLVGAGLLVRSFERLQAVNPGMRAEGAVSMKLALSTARYDSSYKITDFYRRALAGIGAVPGVKAAGLVTMLPLDGHGIGGTFGIQGADSTAPHPFVELRGVSGGYFDAAGIRLLRGRTFTTHDVATAPSVIVINQAMAAILFPKGDALGGRIADGSPDGAEVVGVVANVHQASLTEPAAPGIYVNVAQGGGFLTQSMTLVVRTSGQPLSVVPAVRRALLAVDPAQPVYDIRPLADVVAASIATRRVDLLLLGALAGAALLLAAVGLYGLLTSMVASRAREIGVRVALGGRSGHVLRLIVGKGVRLSALGVVVGVLAALGLSRLMASMLYDTSPTEPATFAGVSLALLLVAAVACVVPCLRALRVDPISVLRQD